MRIAARFVMLACVLGLAGCGNWNPLGWMRSSSSAPQTLTPPGGYPTQQTDRRDLIPQILSAGFQPLNEGRLLVVTAIGPTKGWHSAELLTERVQPAGQLRPDEDGVLRLVLVGLPPPEGSEDLRIAANPQVDALQVALPISHLQWSRISAVTVRAGNNSVTVR
ncbi:MAG: hypothetical protein Q4F71_01780 [Paracoccus sp. (in: a-proteobacteria)]|nr:hypothetical protein [Paracoccus sp. (in: a-proteobacteria)]